MSAPNILARLQVELNVSSYDDGLQSGREAKEMLAALLEKLAERLRTSNEDNFFRYCVDDLSGLQFGFSSLAITGGAL